MVRDAFHSETVAFANLFVNRKLGAANGFRDGDWIWIESPHGKVRCMCRFSEAVEPGTVWTLNAIGKAASAWGLAPKANESQQGFLLNHVISEELSPHEAGEHLSNSDPVTGQAACSHANAPLRDHRSQTEALTQPSLSTSTSALAPSTAPGPTLMAPGRSTSVSG